VHVIKNINGGAGIAGCRIHEALISEGIDSHVFYLEGESFDSGFTKFTPLKRNYISIILNIIAKIVSLKKEASFNIFGYKEIEASSLLKSADCIHLHFINGFINYPTFFKAFAEKKLVFTLHDLNVFLGLYYYPGDVPKPSSIIRFQINNLFSSIKFSFLTDNINFIAPSKWIFEEALKHVNPARVAQISNYIETPTRENDAIRDDGKIKVFFLAEKLSNKRKGVSVLIEAISMLKSNKLIFICAGQSPVTNDKITNLGFLDQSELKNVYSTCDLVVIPSTQENLSNIMLESLSFGTPVVSFDIGGFGDFISHKSNGFLVNDISSEGLAEGLTWLSENLSHLYSRSEIMDDFKDRLKTKNVIKKHIEFYEC
jgi:glycosyltransferase involved in cell wall biosynthesis